jgi:hypothetical protein
VIVAIRDQSDRVAAIYDDLRRVLEARGDSFEVVFVDDGSRDDTRERLEALRKNDPRLRLLELDDIYGAAAALSAGLRHSSGDVVVTIDAEHDDAADIPTLLDEMQPGIQIVAGRRDTTRVGPVDALAVRVTGLPIHDPGCRLRAYRRSILRPIQLPPGSDYFLPALLGVDAPQVAEVPIGDRSRRSGNGIARNLAILRDLLSIRVIIADPRRAEIGFALFTAAAAALGAVVSQTSTPLTVVCDVIALLSGIVWWSARRFNRAQRDGVYRLRENREV